MSQKANNRLGQLSRLATFRFLLPLHSESRGRFIVFSQSRSGTTLLRRLLNSHPDILCEGELLSQRVPWPRLYLEGNRRRELSKVWGCKIFIHHLLRNQKIQHPGSFLSQLSAGGYRIIYLKRENVLRHSVSQWLRKVTGVTHSSSGVALDRHRIDVDFLLRHLETRDFFWKEAERALQGVPFHRLSYEQDLESGERHQQTMDRVFAFLGVEPSPVQADLRRINDKKLSDILENYDEVVRVLSGTRFASWLEERPGGQLLTKQGQSI